MLAKLSFSLRRSAWLLALLIITSALPVSADTPPLYIYELHSSGEGYIFKANSTYYGSDDYVGVLEVPATYNGLPIIGVDFFSNCPKITAVKFPSTIKYITSFKGCTGLTEITLPEDAEEIGSFEGCTNLATVNMNSKLVKIGGRGFAGCTSLKSIVLPKTLRYLGYESFKGCTALESVTFEDGINFFYDGAYRFGTNVFEGCINLSYVKLPETTTEGVYFNIPTGTFIDCINLRSINIPANTNRIEAEAFLRSGLESLDLTPIPETGTVYLAGYYTFAGCKNLKSVKAKCNVEMAYNSQFLNCTALETVNIEGSYPTNYTHLGIAAFKGCTGLKSFKVYRLENLPDSTFAGCTSLTEFAPTYGTAKSIGTGCFAGCTSLETMDYTQHQDNMSIGEGAFSGCTALKSFYFSRITSIGKESFKGCVSLSETPNFGSCYINSVGESAFEGCSSLTRLEFAYLTSVGSKAFAGCSALTTLDFNPFNKYSAPAVASEDAFDEWNYNNTVIDVPDNKYSWFAEHAVWKKFLRIKHPETLAYTSVTGGYSVGKGQYALDGDFTGMLVIPEQHSSGYVVAIAAGAFRNLTGITGVTLPKKLTSIGDEAFAGCTGIKTVINKATTPIECNENIFDASVYAAATLYVPFGSLDAYKNTLPWSKFVNIKQGIGEHTLAVPVASREPGVFNESGFDLTLTNPNETGSIYYYIVPEGDTSTGVRTVSTYSASSPLRISSTCTVVAYIYDGTNCSDPVSLTYTYQYLEPEMNLTVWVNGMEITEENCYDVLGDKGSVTYDMKSGILTLTSATINLPEKVDQAAIVSEGGALTINVDGFNYINAKTMGIFFGYAKDIPTHRICGVGKENNTLTIMLDNSYGEGDAIYAYLSNLEIENCAVMIYNCTNGIFMKPSGLGEDGKLSVLGTSVVGINANHSALTNVVALNLDKGLQILDPVGAKFNPEDKDGNIFDSEGNLSGRLYIGSVEPSNINDIPNIPQGKETVTFTTFSEELSLENNAIGDIYFSITDNTSGCDPKYGLILNAMSSLEDVAQFNSEIESSGYASNSNFNGIAVKVKGTGSVTFPSIQNSGSARLTILLGDGTPVYGDELPGLKYEFTTAKAKYLYIFGTLKDTKSAPSLKEIKPGADYVNIYSMEIEITDINGGVINTENGLDKVLAAGADDCCRINTTLFGHYHDGKYLYASTMGNSGSAKNTINEDKKDGWWSDKESDFNQEDWVAVSGLNAEFVGQEIAGGNVATVISNTAYPVISFDDKVSYTKSKGMGINTFRVANFNINAKSEAVSNIWLVAPQPAEYCTVTGYVSSKNIYAEEGYLVLQSAEGPTIKEDKTVIEPLTMNVYYDQAALKLGADGWYAFTGIVSKEGDVLKFTALEANDKPTGVEGVDAATARVFAAAGNINVIADTQSAIAVYSANGQLVTALEATDATIAVSPGFYIVKVGNQVTKLAVK